MNARGEETEEWRREKEEKKTKEHANIPILEAVVYRENVCVFVGFNNRSLRSYYHNLAEIAIESSPSLSTTSLDHVAHSRPLRALAGSSDEKVSLHRSWCECHR